MSFTSAITFDFEVYSAAFGSAGLRFPLYPTLKPIGANRLKCRYRGEDKKTHLCHTLNGSASPCRASWPPCWRTTRLPRGIVVPECLRKYTGFDIIN